METIVRKPFQGVANIVRFNWHFYVIAVMLGSLLFLAPFFVSPAFQWVVRISLLGIGISTVITLLVSYYVYDHSGLYHFEWLHELHISGDAHVVNINAGFDETSAILTSRYPNAVFQVFDFYDPEKHTEISIERARKAYPSFPGTIPISTTHIPVVANSIDVIFNIFALHEIRNREERVMFLKKQHEILKPGGMCLVVEHLRDIPNFLAYNIGFFHFYGPAEWKRNFSSAGFSIEKIHHITPFVKAYFLKK